MTQRFEKKSYKIFIKVFIDFHEQKSTEKIRKK